MNFNQNTVGAGGHGGARHWWNLVAAAGAVRGIGQDRKVREFLDHGNGGNIQGIAGVAFKSTNAALAEHDLVIASGHDVLGRQQPFFDRCRWPAFQQHRFAELPQFLQQVEILHIPGADLQNIDKFQEHWNLCLIHDFGDHE